MAAFIELSRGIKEVPTKVKILKSKSSERSSAIFRFEDLKTEGQEILNMVMVDEEGEIVCRDVKAKFLNGQFTAIEATYEMETTDQWDRFMRFMERFSAENEMGMGE